MFPVFAGSVEFVSVNMLLGAFHPFKAFAMMLMINARHLFYAACAAGLLIQRWIYARYLEPMARLCKMQRGLSALLYVFS